jgi:hypothetical protein
MEHFQFWRRCLLILSALFALQAVSWALIGSFDPFGFYESYMARSLWGADRLPVDAQRAFAFTLVPFGATTAAYFLLVFLIVKHAFPRREPWAYQAVVGATLAWFVLDTGLCVYHRAWFNILIVNLPCILMLGVPLFALRRHFVGATPGSEPVALSRLDGS